MISNNVYFFIPSIIGYIRIILMVIAFALWTNPVILLGCYSISFLLDEFDGILARRFNQTSKFGATMDMYTDLASTSGLITLVCLLYPSYTVPLVLLMMLNMSSHSILTYAALLEGKDSHKDMNEHYSPIVVLYYSNNIVLDVLWASQDFFYLSVFALYYYPDNVVWQSLAYITAIPFGLKQIVTFFQLTDSMKVLAKYDQEKRDRNK